MARLPLHPRTIAPAALAGLLALATASCGGGSSDASSDAPVSTTSAPASTTAATTAAAPVSADACALLGPDVLAETITFDRGEAGVWTETQGDTSASCAWMNDAQVLTVSIEVHDGIDETIGALSDTSTVTLDEVPVGATTATGERDVTSERLRSLYVPAGADSVVVVGQMPLKLSDEQLAAVAETAAIAFENSDANATGTTSGSDGDGTAMTVHAPEGVDSVRFTVQSADAGLDLDFEVTAEEVEAGGNPITTGITCTGATAGDNGIFEGLYAVSATKADHDPGLTHAAIESADKVTTGGTYQGTFTATDSKQRAVEVSGDLTIDDGLRSGELVGKDDAGNDVTVTWECRPI